MKKISIYIIIYVCTVQCLFSSLVVSSMIPRSAIEQKLKESANYYKKRPGIYKIKYEHRYSYIHYFADTRKLNIIFCIDSEHPVESTLWSKYYQTVKKDTNTEFINLVERNEEPTTQYLRYWNGCMLFLRPLLIIFNMEQIYFINQIVLSILFLAMFIILFKKSKKIAFIFLLALILVSVWYASFYIEGSVMFYVMLITSMIAIKMDSNKKKYSKDEVLEKLSKLFLITGIVTTFFDFLTTEILTLFVPLMLILLIRKEEKRIDNLKDTFKFVIRLCILWFIGYAGMWIAKWVLSSLILHINSFEYVKENAILRINGLQGLSNHEQLYKNVIGRNLFAIPLLYIIKTNFFKWKVKLILVIVIALLLLFINWKELKNKKYLLILVFIGIMPYIRYLILANHSYRHAMFTFRDQIITIMALTYIIIDCLNYKLLFRKIELKKSKKTS